MGKPDFLVRIEENEARGRAQVEAAVRRMQAGLELTQFGYDAPRNGYEPDHSSRGRKATLYDEGGSETWKKQRKRYQDIWEARLMEDRFCIISGMLERMAQYVVGTLEYQAATGDDKADSEYEDYFHDWCGRADYTGRHRLQGLAELAMRGLWRDGEAGFVLHFEAGEWRMQSVEADRIGNPEVMQSNFNEFEFQGIHVNGKGQPVQYDIYKRDRNNHYTFDAGVPASRFLHLFRPTRADQYHGVSVLAPALPHARDLYELFGHEKVAAKFAASFAAFVTSEDPTSPDGAFGWDKNSPENGNWGATQNGGVGGKHGQVERMRSMAGQIVKLQKGEEGIEFAPGTTRPSGAFMALVDALIREIAMSSNLPYGFIYDMSRFGGVTARLETQQAQRTFERYQKILTHRVLDPMRDKVIGTAILKGDLRPTKKWKGGSFQFGRHITGDVGHQTQADWQMVQAGVKSLESWGAELGSDVYDVMEKNALVIKRAQELAKKFKVPIELFLPLLPNPTSALAQMERLATGEADPEAPPPPPPGLIGQQGEKGVKPLMEILENVGNGSMDREMGLAGIQTVYGVSRQEAEMMLPASQSF